MNCFEFKNNNFLGNFLEIMLNQLRENNLYVCKKAFINAS